MLNRIFICFFLLFLALESKPQERTYPAPAVLTLMIKKSQPDTNRVGLFLQMAGATLFRDHIYQADFDTAYSNISKALSLSSNLHSEKWKIESMKYKAFYFLKKDDLINARTYYTQVISYYRSRSERKNEAMAWTDFGDNISNNSSELTAEKLRDYELAGSIFSAIHDKLNEILSLKNIADLHLNQGHLDLAKSELLSVIAQFKAIHYKNLHHTYYLLSAVSRLQGDLQKELFYGLEAIKSMEATSDTTSAALFYYRLGETYQDLGMPDQSLLYFKKSLTKNISSDGRSYIIIQRIVQVLLSQNKAGEALSFLRKNARVHPAVTFIQKNRLSRALGECYFSLKDYDRAEKYYLEMIRFSDLGQKEQPDVENRGRDYKLVSDFYVHQQNFQKAIYFAKKLANVPKSRVSPIIQSQIQKLQFKIDSAAGNYLNAINHYEGYRKLDDSLFNATKAKQISELDISYKTAQKDKDIELQQKKNQLLEKDAVIQAKSVIQLNQSRNFYAIGVLMLIILLGISVNRYRIKQRHNNQLKEKQKEISAKNDDLEKLLHENEWLLREVHHRVKNNLQVIISLLNSQSAYLKDDVALNAVLESQHRIQAMSLIHHKLYKTNNVSNIYMPEYINDLVDYLKDSFKSSKTVYFELNLEPINLDVTRAVPVGLIMNEVITNSLKYAFPFSDDDKICIQLFASNPDELTLIISDNGRGLPANFNIDINQSFGLTLIKGLAEDLDGQLNLTSVKGTKIEMVFNNAPISNILS